jgi:hypothetical protein
MSCLLALTRSQTRAYYLVSLIAIASLVVGVLEGYVAGLQDDLVLPAY